MPTLKAGDALRDKAPIESRSALGAAVALARASAGLATTALLAGVLLAGCATSAVRMATGSTEDEREIGDQQAKLIERAVDLDPEPKVNGYVSAIGERLAAQAARKEIEYRFYVVDMAVPNAFAIPGGRVYLSCGLLALVNSEEELAGVMGHEIGHVEARHAVKRSRASLAVAPVQIATGITGIAASLISPSLGASIIDAGQTAAQTVLAPYSRDQEREADRLGQDIAARAGWDPRGLTSLLGTLGREEQLAGVATNGFLSTHPATPERVSATGEYGAKLEHIPQATVAGNHAALLARLDGLLLAGNPQRGTFADNVFMLPNADLRIAFPPNWKVGSTANSVGARSQDKAAAILLQPAAADTDLVSAARAQEKKAGVKLVEGSRQMQIAGLPALRRDLTARGDKDTFNLSLVWIQLGRIVWSIVAVVPSEKSPDHADEIEASIASFGRLGDADKKRITAPRLRVVTALAGETLESLRARTGSLWSVQQTAVANGIAENAKFSGGERIKIAVREPFIIQ